MQTLGEAFSLRGRDDSNNFLLLRLLAASLVIYGHSFALAADCGWCRDVVTSVFHYRYSGDLGLHIFFVISGFLVTASFDSRQNVTEFLKARALRIFPGLVVCIALLVFLGAFLTVLDSASYWSAGETRKFFWTNSSLLGYRDKLPGVFETNKFGLAVNGSLWTLWIEARLYRFAP